MEEEGGQAGWYGGKWADRGGARAGEDGGYRREEIGTSERAGEQARRWRQVEVGGGGRPEEASMEEAAAEMLTEADGGGVGARVEYAFGWRRRASTSVGGGLLDGIVIGEGVFFLRCLTPRSVLDGHCISIVG